VALNLDQSTKVSALPPVSCIGVLAMEIQCGVQKSSPFAVSMSITVILVIKEQMLHYI